jgi:hypothetical protein
MLNIDEYKIAQLALDYYMEHGDLTPSEKYTAKRAYEKLDPLIDGDEVGGWCIDDVFGLMYPDDDGETAREYTEDDYEIAREVLQAAEHGFDATMGINWDVLQYHLDEVLEARR